MKNVKKENRIRSFKWRITEELRLDRGYEKRYYFVERKIVYFGLIPLWWSRDWEQYNFDGVNTHIRNGLNYHKNLNDAKDDLNFWKKETSYFNRTFILNKTVVYK